jgi:hypothetical protein
VPHASKFQHQQILDKKSWNIPWHNHQATPLCHVQIGTFGPVRPKLPSSDIQQSRMTLFPQSSQYEIEIEALYNRNR